MYDLSYDQHLVIGALSVCAIAISVALSAVPLAQSVNGPAQPDVVLEVNASTGSVENVIRVGKDPLSLTIAGGTVWVHDVEDGTLSRIDRASNVATVISLRDVVSMAAAGDDVCAAYEGNRLARLDGRTGKVERTLRIGSKRLFKKRDAGFVAFARGAVWVTIPVLGRNEAPQRLVRIEQTTGALTANVSIPADPAPPLVAGRYLWIVGRYANVISRLDMTTRRLRTVPVGPFPFVAAAGAGSIWVAHDYGRAVWRLDPVSLHVRARIAVGARARGVAFGRARVWVTTETGLSAIDPKANRVVNRWTLTQLRVDDGPIGVGVLNGSVWVSVE